MLASEVLFACVMGLVTHGPTPAMCKGNDLALEIADAIEGEAGHGIPNEVVAGDIWKESTFRPDAIGLLGEVGLMQVKRGGAVQGKDLLLTDAELADVHTNIRIGVGYMRQIHDKCKGPPRYWLSRYNGRACAPSVYSARVLSAVARGKHLLRRLTVRERKFTS